MSNKREELYRLASEALTGLHEVKDGDDKQIAFWCGATSRRVADFVRDCLADVSAKTEHKVIMP